MGKLALAVHGGAGTILSSQMTPALEAEYRGGLEAALKAGWDVLGRGGAAMDAVESAVRSLEDFPLFNAGRGSVFTAEGKNEMDAAIMDGARLRAGAVAFVRNVRNPVRLARLVMERTEHVLLAGDGANQFAREMGAETAADEYFFTEHRWLQLQEAIGSGRVQLDHADDVTAETPRRGDNEAETQPVGSMSKSESGKGSTGVTHVNPKSKIQNPKSLGTVGAVACDADGRLAAATSTGGMTNKRFGRVGDSALIGAGTYADDICAVSCTGHGEFFMLGATAYDVAARMRHKGLSLEEAARETIDRLSEIGGEGGLIAVDASGNIVLPFNSGGMYRGFIAEDGRAHIAIYR
jgi:beta-aspartyl-peptidase (threonine type)